MASLIRPCVRLAIHPARDDAESREDDKAMGTLSQRVLGIEPRETSFGLAFLDLDAA